MGQPPVAPFDGPPPDDEDLDLDELLTALSEVPEASPARSRRHLRQVASRFFLDHWRWFALATAVLWFAIAGYQMVRAAQEVTEGRRLVESVRQATAAGLLKGEAAGRLDQAARRFAAANDRINSPFLWPVRYAPVLGRQLTSLDALTDSGADALSAAERALAEVRGLLDEAAPPATERVALLSELQAIVQELEGEFEGLDLGPDDALFGPVVDARNQLSETLDDARDLIDRSEVALGGVRELLQGPSRYLLLVTNNAEMRAGSGMILSVGELTIENGEIRLGEIFEAEDLELPAGAVPIDDPDLAARWGWAAPSEEWRSLALSPRFDVTAPLAARMWEAFGNTPVDGVLAVDPFGLRAILRATGPVRVGTKRVAAGNVVAYTLHDQYQALGSETRRREQVQRREELAAVARATLEALTEGHVDATALIEQIVTAGQGRHVMVWSRDPDQQAAWQAADAGGEVGDQSVLLSVLNRGENKLDYFLEVDATVEVSSTDDSRDVAVTVELRNTTPQGEPPYIAGEREFGVAEGEYLGILALNVPGSALDGRIEGVDSPAVLGSDGPSQVLGVLVRIPRDGTATHVFRFRVPAAVEAIEVEPSARALPILWSYRFREWEDNRPRTIILE